MRCKACNDKLDVNFLYPRVIAEGVVIEEDLCTRCRAASEGVTVIGDPLWISCDDPISEG